jgi:hypothetical protein
MKILIITDSLGLPRIEPQKVDLEETWPYLVQKKFKDDIVVQMSLGGATVGELHNQVSYYRAFHPDVVLVQSGIVDCAPRAFKRGELELMQRLPLFSKFVLPMVKKRTNYIRSKRNVCYTQPALFSDFINGFIAEFSKEKLYWIGIIPAVEAYEKKLPGITNAINNYNKIIQNTLGDHFIETREIPEEGIMPDFHHLNDIGNKYVFDQIVKKLER